MPLRHRTRQERSGAPLHSEGSAHSCRILALGVVYFGAVVGLYGLGLWLPAILRSFGLSSMQTGALGSLSALAGAIGMVLWTRQSDATNERRWHMVLPCVVGAIGPVIAGGIHSPTVSFLLLIAAGFDVYTSLTSFWPPPTAMPIFCPMSE